MWGYGLLLSCVIASAGSAHAEPPSADQIRFVLKWAAPAQAAGARIDDTVPVIVAFMRRDDVDGVPGLSRADAELRVLMESAGRGLEPLHRLLASDLDANLEVHRSRPRRWRLSRQANLCARRRGCCCPTPTNVRH